ncbi:MAG: hypothetical protein AB8B55_14080 [Mariniblastus sp.]
MFEAFAIRLLKATQTVEGARKILHIGWETTWSILERAVERGQARKQSARCLTSASTRSHSKKARTTSR